MIRLETSEIDIDEMDTCEMDIGEVAVEETGEDKGYHSRVLVFIGR